MKTQLHYLVTALIVGIIMGFITTPLAGVLSGLGIMAHLIIRVWYKELRPKVGRFAVITIWKGFHRPFPWFVIKPFIWRKSKPLVLTIIVKFTNESLFANVQDSWVNKLFGFTPNTVHKDSFRWGWKQDMLGNLYLNVYKYQDSFRHNAKEIGILRDRSYKLQIVAHNNTVQYLLDDEVVYIVEHKFNKINLCWMLGVYAGGGNGKYKADRKMKLYSQV